MRVPYTVGRWVRDRNHYGRQRLLDYLLNTPDAAVWVIGARRIGKTSLLRQLEFLTDQADGARVPLFWDMQGCENSGDLSFELYLALEDARARYAQAGIAVEPYAGQDAVVILRRLSQQLAERGRVLCLLIDEAEVLIEIARREPDWIERLRSALTGGNGKTIVASTKLLAQLNQVTATSQRGPFLSGFTIMHLWNLDTDAAVALVEQRQTGQPVAVAPAIREAILKHTSCHPYLIQYLCQRLYCADGEARPSLRMPTDEELEPNHLLAGFFAIDFQHLTGLERKIVLTVAECARVSEQEIRAASPDEPPARLRTFLWGLNKLGQLRMMHGQWTIGNEFLRRWLVQTREQLEQMEETPLDDATYEQILHIGQLHDASALIADQSALEMLHASLRARLHSTCGREGAQLAHELETIASHLAEVRQQLQRTIQLSGIEA
jgi:hypothetical protein